MVYRPSFRIGLGTAAAALLSLLALWPAAAVAEPKTVCTITINSSDESEALQRHLPRDQYRFVELVQHGRSDWLAQACQQRVSCDALVISGHFDDGTEFYTDRFDDRENLTMHELQEASCSASCNGLFSQLKEVYLFGCNTLQSAPRHVATAEVTRSLLRAGSSPAEAERVSTLLSERYGQSNRDRLRHVFKDVPVLYGFSSKAPLGRVAGPLLESYFKSAPAGEIASGRPSPTLLNLFGPSSMVAVAGLTDADPHASFRRDMCGFADEQPSPESKITFLHQVLRRDVTEVRMFLDHIERYVGSLSLAQRLRPEVAAGLDAIRDDQAVRERFLEFARDADQATVQARMIALARNLAWLTPAQEQEEFLRMIASRMTHKSLGKYEVDLICNSALSREPGLAQRLLASGAVRPDDVAHSAALACMGDGQAHERTLRALTSAQDDDVAMAQVYLRHRPLGNVAELRTVTSQIGRMNAGGAQVRALETLARQRLEDPQSLQEIAGLFPMARSLDAQRAIAGILIRSDYKKLAQTDLARVLRQHRMKSPDGNDVIEMLIRLLQQSA